ncbi:phosphocholine hydrolase Lem3 [Legionella pneumophila]|uniref:phosphocholine hydrolase Lem3 n=1 Tax=Legionella pneumophila TaxID=446 RepID=UPI0009B484A7|nr:phosphocholine hydrolase Lem3 [Legionella pneumophila]MCW8427661.1 phosphocholine hydrolase Lem3 [Legionella pneumophila]HAT6810926.1 phosphocholine hydrolase Lem3 [Legionella pneumophila]HAT8671278.1 phosphocholine hydrolase Lem3 [Legionella pneumophila]HAU1605479.1 phosphocholine hydrolase Lem3 [Legionella pneumophila]HAU1847662.1 phosphocholine hydrolase Lem3 [Legionella pneumophila]
MKLRYIINENKLVLTSCNMRDKIITGKKIIFSQSVAKDQTKGLSSFLSERFYSVNQSHNHAIIIGSSLSHQEKDIEHDTILDSSGVLVTTDTNGIINGARVAITDGLGGGNGDQEEDDEIYRVSHSSCEIFLNCDQNIDATLSLITQPKASEKKQTAPKKSQLSEASMAAFIYKHNQGQGFIGEFANIGDGLIIILDKRFKIKHMLPACHIYRGFGTWTPPSLQALATTANKDALLVRKTLQLAEGDIIISMTDGIWGELKTSLFAQTNDRRDIGVDKEYFKTLFDELTDAPYPSSYDIARIITHRAMSRSLERRKTLTKLIHEIEQQHFHEKSVKTINEVLKHFIKTGNTETAQTLKAILFEDGLSDGITYFENIEIPLEMVMQDLKSRTVGDCSTINVTRIPYHLDELIRGFINYPEKHQILAPLFKATIKSEADLEEAFHRLSLEMIQPEIECPISEAHFERAFKKETLDKAQAILIHYFRISIGLDSKKSYQERLNDLSSYLFKESSLEKNDIKLLLSMLDSEIKPKTGVFQTLFGENQSKLYKAFHKKIELHLLEGEIDNKKEFK